MVGCALQLFQQLSGINTVMYYSARIIQLAGFTSETAAIWLAAVTAAVNFGATFIGLYYVDKKGRRPLLLTSLWGVVVSLLLLSGSFFLIDRQARSIVNLSHSSSVGQNTSLPDSDQCTLAESCFDCVDNLSGCGFCMAEGGGGQCVSMTVKLNNIT